VLCAGYISLCLSSNWETQTDRYKALSMGHNNESNNKSIIVAVLIKKKFQTRKHL
jgi:hypothetical protein